MFVEFTLAGTYKRPTTINSDKIVSITPRGNVDDEETIIITVDGVANNVSESYNDVCTMLGIGTKAIND